MLKKKKKIAHLNILKLESLLLIYFKDQALWL